MMPPQQDSDPHPDRARRAAVVGSGPNGLTAACRLARAGWEVTVHEAAAEPGGALRSGRLFSSDPTALSDLGASVHPFGAASPAFGELDLTAHGLRWAHPQVPLAHGLDGAPPALLHHEPDRTARGLGDDGEAWRRLMSPLIGSGDASDRGRRLLGAAMTAPGHLLRDPGGRLSADHIGALLHRAPEVVSPLSRLVRRFDQEPARALLAGAAAHSTAPLGLPGTAAFGLLFALAAHTVGWPVVRGGSQGLVDALVSALHGAGGVVRTGEPVDDVARLRAETGADVVLCDVTPAQLLRIAGEEISPRLRPRLRSWEPGPGIVKLDLLLDGPIPWRHAETARAGTVHLGGGHGQIIASERAVSRGILPARPFVLLAQPAAADESRAEAGRTVCWAYAHGPAGLEGAGVVRAARMIEQEIAAQAPGLADRILERRIWSPGELERWNPNLAGGSLSGGVPTPGQLVRRPASLTAPYRMGRGLYLCSASTPPGGGAHGMCGWGAAGQVLGDLARDGGPLRAPG
ncbi:MAG: NAD(P)/FAD-dependent oxidoreductase [Nesterenkonia sp.]|nr:NAD(P)/FAD-dependent oxidoreductase [Nesterenkonia sp.]